MSDEQFDSPTDIVLFQDRVIVRLRAALLANGLNVSEVDAIARDADMTTEVPKDLEVWKQDTETEIQRVFDVAQSDLHHTIASFQQATKAFGASVDQRFARHLELIGDVTRAYNVLEGRTIRGRARRLWRWLAKLYAKVRYSRLFYEYDDDDDDDVDA